MTNSQQVRNEPSEKTVSRAIGEELRRARESVGWSRGQLVARLPSGIGDRTLLSYEHGTRHLTVIRLLEVCRALGFAAPTLLSNALQRARLDLAHLALRVELKPLIEDKNVKFRPMTQWAKNKLNKCPDGIAELPPSSVQVLAEFVGHSYEDLANYLAKFVPDSVPETTDDAEDEEESR